jgi:hypothetical protein
MVSKRTAQPGERCDKSVTPDTTIGFHPALRLRIEILRPPHLESLREDIIFGFLRPTPLKVEGSCAVVQRSCGPRLDIPNYRVQMATPMRLAPAAPSPHLRLSFPRARVHVEGKVTLGPRSEQGAVEI